MSVVAGPRLPACRAEFILQLTHGWVDREGYGALTSQLTHHYRRSAAPLLGLVLALSSWSCGDDGAAHFQMAGPDGDVADAADLGGDETSRGDAEVTADATPDAPEAGDAADADADLDEPGPVACVVAGDFGVQPSAADSTVAASVDLGCSTTLVVGLSEQLIDEFQCMAPGAMQSIAEVAHTTRGSAVFPYLQVDAAQALGQAAAEADADIHLTSAYRTIPQQYLLWRWGQRGLCGIGLAAKPGNSNHQSGLALDVSNHAVARAALEGAGFRWFGAADAVHFDYAGAGQDLRSTSVLAFQRLWNHNNLDDLIEEDGVYGAETEARLEITPAQGFASPAPCDRAELGGLAVSWIRDESGVYRFTTDASAEEVERVTVTVDGWDIGAVELPGDGPAEFDYTFSQSSRFRRLEALGWSDGRVVAAGVGLIDTVAEPAVSIAPVDGTRYLFALERPPGCVDRFDLAVDGEPMGSALSGQPITADVGRHGPTDVTFTLLDAAAGPAGVVRRRFDFP